MSIEKNEILDVLMMDISTMLQDPSLEQTQRAALVFHQNFLEIYRDAGNDVVVSQLSVNTRQLLDRLLLNLENSKGESMQD